MVTKTATKSNIVDTFIELVQIDSVSRQEAGVRKFILQKFKALGYPGRTDKKGNLHFKIPGLLVHGPVILFNAHMDTVVPGKNIKPQLKKDRITSDGTTILGADDKAGIAAIIETVRLIKKQQAFFQTLKIIFTVEEEIGLRGAKMLTREEVAADYCFVLDSDGNVGSIVNQAPSQEILDITVTGRAAHAGLSPEKGISAIQIAAAAITELKLGRLDEETTANIGIIRGGSATNIIPETVELKAEARSHSEAKLQEQLKLIKASFNNAAQQFGGTAKIVTRRAYNNVAVDKSAKIIEVARQAAKALGLPFKIKSSGGGSDASIIHSYGIPTIALCIGMEQVHSRQEYILLKNLKMLPGYLLEILKAAHHYGKH